MFGGGGVVAGKQRTKGVFAILYLVGSARPTGSGLGWPALATATHRVCVHVRNESGQDVVLFATPQPPAATRDCLICDVSVPREAKPRKTNPSTVSREPGGAIAFAHAQPSS